ncbi:DNA-binding protein [Latilactobacillus sakei]|uniref:putative DNA-binding protein n=1 Tax=Latilactobacillus sakei TaxID=1599 RepID=UPI000A17C047|nr:putative DNA-binding protein [Latilactobacillus sakei]ARJ72736.1 DNA-binding protein [Latilactobacillus sakei]MCE8501965.1 putative DNA-binding protein [Latilactobacillus sakei]USG02188.1 DNA-binding protein [Latilactobacillus sakei]
MELAQNARMNSLFEFYGALLTAKQHSYLSLYYGDDFSLGEIAEEYQVSRQAVYDNIRRTEKILEGYEAKLHLFQNYEQQNASADALQKYIHAQYPNDQQLAKLLADLLNLTEQ